MCRIFSFLFLIYPLTVHAEEPLTDFSMTIACDRIASNGPTMSTMVDINYDGKANACKSSEAKYFERNITLPIDFTCKNPKPIFRDDNQANQLWVLEAPGENNPDLVNRLVLVFDHKNKVANGFAHLPNGSSYPVYCKKW